MHPGGSGRQELLGAALLGWAKHSQHWDKAANVPEAVFPGLKPPWRCSWVCNAGLDPVVVLPWLGKGLFSFFFIAFVASPSKPTPPVMAASCCSPGVVGQGPLPGLGGFGA